MSTRNLFHALVPYLILLFGNGLWGILGIVYKALVPSATSDTADLMLSYGYAVTVILVLYFFYYKKNYAPAGDTVHPRYGSAVFLGACCFFVFSGILGLLGLAFPEAFFSYNASLSEIPLAGNPLLWIYSILLAPLAEELCFRELCLPNLARNLQFATANVIQAFFFAAIHANFIQVAYAFFLGLILGRVCRHLGGFRAACAFHMTFNALNLPLYFWIGGLGTPFVRFLVYTLAGLLPLLFVFFRWKVFHARKS